MYVIIFVTHDWCLTFLHMYTHLYTILHVYTIIYGTCIYTTLYVYVHTLYTCVYTLYTCVHNYLHVYVLQWGWGWGWRVINFIIFHSFTISLGLYHIVRHTTWFLVYNNSTCQTCAVNPLFASHWNFRQNLIKLRKKIIMVY